MQFWSLVAKSEATSERPGEGDLSLVQPFETPYLEYAAVQALQKQLVSLRLAEKIPDTVLFLEHQAVVTVGRGLQKRSNDDDDNSGHHQLHHLLPPPLEVPVVPTERGGGLTYHGPGQLVIYPICRLSGQGRFPHHDVLGFIRVLEQWVIDELQARGLRSHAQPGATGVWVGEKKVASLGIAVRGWVTYHGLALNMTTDLSRFFSFDPCGFAPEVMTRLQDCLPSFSQENWRQEWEQALAQRIEPGATVESLTWRQAQVRVAQLRLPP